MPLTFGSPWRDQRGTLRRASRRPLYVSPLPGGREHGRTPLVCGRCLEKRGSYVRLGTVGPRAATIDAGTWFGLDPGARARKTGSLGSSSSVFLQPGFAQRPDGVWELSRRARAKLAHGHAIDADERRSGDKRVGPTLVDFPAQVRCPADGCGAINTFERSNLLGP